MPKLHSSTSKFTYIHDEREVSFQAVDAHHILVRKCYTRDAILCFIILVLVVNTYYTLLEKAKLRTGFIWNIILGVFLAASLHWKPIQKESVVIMPGFGIQLETHYTSGKIVRRFVPIAKILKAVLNECVTPVTCYWSLALILHGDTELTLVFQDVRPPVKMLVPVWKALCAAIDGQESRDPVVEEAAAATDL